jgi:hypothetical protein
MSRIVWECLLYRNGIVMLRFYLKILDDFVNELLMLPLCFAEETRFLIALASEWLELDSPVEGIRFDSEIVRNSSLPVRSCHRLTFLIRRSSKKSLTHHIYTSLL